MGMQSIGKIRHKLLDDNIYYVSVILWNFSLYVLGQDIFIEYIWYWGQSQGD